MCSQELKNESACHTRDTDTDIWHRNPLQHRHQHFIQRAQERNNILSKRAQNSWSSGQARRIIKCN